MSHIHLVHLYVCTLKSTKPTIYGEYIFASRDLDKVTDTLKYNELDKSPNDEYFVYRLAVPESYKLEEDVNTGLVKIPNSTSVTYVYDGIKTIINHNLEEEANAIKSLHLNNTGFCGG